MTSPVHDMADRPGSVTHLPALPANTDQSPMVVESLRQLLAGLNDGSVDAPAAAARVQSIIFLATCNRGMRALHEVARKHGVHVRDIRSTNRTKYVVAARNELAHRLVRELGWSLPRTGEFIGRDHSTILHAVRQHEEWLAAQ